MDSRWVIRFKYMTDQPLTMRSRSCIRGFKDGQVELLDTFAGTAPRCGQRAVNIISASKRWSHGLSMSSQAVLKGFTFEEVSRMTGCPLR